MPLLHNAPPKKAQFQPINIPKPTGNTFWRRWPAIAWLFPVVLIILRLFSPDAGWEALVAVVWSPVIILVFGLLASLPRFVLRKRGHSTSPNIVSLLMVTNWVSILTATLAIPGIADNGSSGTPLSALFGFSESFGQAFLLPAALLAIASYVAAIVLTVMLKPGEHSKRGSHLVWAAILITPLVIALFAGVISYF